MRPELQATGNRIRQFGLGVIFKCGLAIIMVATANGISKADYTAYGSVVINPVVPKIGGMPVVGATVTIYESNTGRTIGFGQTGRNGVFQIYCRTSHKVPVGNHYIRTTYSNMSGSWGRNMISTNPRHPIALAIRPR